MSRKTMLVAGGAVVALAVAAAVSFTTLSAESGSVTVYKSPT